MTPASIPAPTARSRGHSLTIRPATPTDWPAVASLLRDAHLPSHDLGPGQLDGFLLAERDGELHGVVGLEGHGPERLLRSLAVSERAQGRGLGHQLLHAAEARARDEQARALWLLTTTAAGFFARAGYHPAPRESAPAALRLLTEFTSVCPTTATCMTKPLQAAAPH